MDCKIIEVEQGSDAWLNLRRCRITASRLGDVMAAPSTKRYADYQTQIAQELSGIEQPEKDSPWFAHGKEMEPRALAAYDWKYKEEMGGKSLVHDVFLVHHEYDWLGCSPDGLVPIYKPTDDPDVSIFTGDYSAGVEVKCRALYKNYRQETQKADHFELIDATKSVSPAYRFQVQGAMWVTGLESWFMVNYYEGPDLDGAPQRKLHRVEIPRDDELIDKMELRCLAFIHECYEIAGLEV